MHIFLYHVNYTTFLLYLCTMDKRKNTQNYSIKATPVSTLYTGKKHRLAIHSHLFINIIITRIEIFIEFFENNI